MKILALDIATRTGFALGEAGETPKSGTVRLKQPKEEREVGCFNLGAFLRDRFVLDRPDLVVIESYLNPVAQPSADAAISQLMFHGAAQCVIRLYGIAAQYVAPATWRRHFIGMANAGKRDATKALVINRARALRYIPADCSDDNRADACGIFDYASAVLAHRPISLVLHGANA